MTIALILFFACCVLLILAGRAFDHERSETGVALMICACLNGGLAFLIAIYLLSHQ